MHPYPLFKFLLAEYQPLKVPAQALFDPVDWQADTPPVARLVVIFPTNYSRNLPLRFKPAIVAV
jgi:hypothetical protein